MNKKELLRVEKSLSAGSIGSYIHWANQIPMLSQEEEIELGNRLRENNDLDAARKLVLSHLRLVVRIARGYSGYGLAQADLIQEGNIGLMKAVKRFDPSIGVRLVSFAVHWIRAEIHEFILRNWRIVKIATTKAQRKLFFNLRKMAKNRGWFSRDEIDTVANVLNVSHQEVRKMEQRLNNYDLAFDSRQEDEESDSGWSAPAQYLEDYRYNPAKLLESDDWQNNRQNKLYTALDQLDERSRDILEQRWLKEQKLTLHQLADKYQVSAERVRQLEKNALGKLRNAISCA